MQDVLIAFRRYRFLGPEFLTWLWYITENEPETVSKAAGEPAVLVVGNRIALEKKRADDVEKVSIRGETAQMDEGLLALSKGAMVTDVNLSLEAGGLKWTFNVRGEDLAVSGLRTPATGPVTVKDDIEGALLEKLSLCEKPLKVLDALYKHFISLRITEAWKTTHLPQMKKWLKNP